MNSRTFHSFVIPINHCFKVLVALNDKGEVLPHLQKYIDTKNPYDAHVKEHDAMRSKGISEHSINEKKRSSSSPKSSSPKSSSPKSSSAKSPPQYATHTAASEVKHAHVMLGIPSHTAASDHKGRLKYCIENLVKPGNFTGSCIIISLNILFKFVYFFIRILLAKFEQIGLQKESKSLHRYKFR
jgi:hypothetical protein